jgi:hypothetical protein
MVTPQKLTKARAFSKRSKINEGGLLGLDFLQVEKPRRG